MPCPRRQWNFPHPDYVVGREPLLLRLWAEPPQEARRTPLSWCFMWLHFTDEKLRPTGKWLKALQGSQQDRVDLCPLSGWIWTQLRPQGWWEPPGWSWGAIAQAAGRFGPLEGTEHRWLCPLSVDGFVSPWRGDQHRCHCRRQERGGKSWALAAHEPSMCLWQVCSAPPSLVSSGLAWIRTRVSD